MKKLSDTFILAVDHGTSGVKTALMTAGGELIDYEFEKTTIRFLPGGGAEQDPEEWWRALAATARRLMEKGLAPPEKVAAVCCSSTFSSTVAVNKEGEHLGNCLTWMDSRGAPYIKELVSGFPSIMGYSVFTMLPWIFKTAGGPQLSGKDDLAHVLFWKNERPEVYEKAFMFMGSKDYLNLRLCGVFAATYDSMSLFWLTNIRNPRRMFYDPWLIKKAGIDPEKLPPMRGSAEVLGPLLPEVAEELGLSRNTVVVAGSPDHQAACMGSGAVRDFEGHLYIGTSSWIQCIVPFKKTDMFHSIATLPTSIPGKYYAVNEQDVAGGALSFLAERILYGEEEPVAAAAPADVYERLDRAAGEVPPGSRGVLFTPWLNGERTPVDDPFLGGVFFNLSMTTSRADLARAVMEGVALNTRWLLFYLEKFIKRPFPWLNLVGGGARSKTWRRILCDVLDREVRVVEHPLWANARGAAFIAAVGLGLIDFNDIPGLVKIEETLKPEPENRKLYEELFKDFIALYKRNRAIFHRLNRSEGRG